MKIFVTGGTGFIGAPVIKKLLQRKHQLLIISRQSLNHLPEYYRNRQLTHIRGNLNQAGQWQARVRRFRPDAAIHLAWEGLPDYGVAMSRRNLSGGLDLFEFLGSSGCKKVLAVGTCWEYGVQTGKLSESMGTRPLNAFSAAKNALHYLGEQIAKEHGMRFIWVRPFFVYGPGQRSKSLIPYLISCQQQGIPAQIKNPNGANDFIYVGDLAEAIALILTRSKQNNASYNIGSGRLTSIQEVIDRLSGKPLRRRIYQKATGFYADISLIKKEIGWQPKMNLARGIELTAASLRTTLLR